MNYKNFFLPYQKKWLNDTSRFKIYRKSRRTGITWCQSFEDVRDANSLKIRGKYPDVWFSSADASSALEYILYCESWAKAINASFESLGEIIIDEEKDIKAYSMQFKNGARINALSSNPSAFRSKGGKVVLDEFAFHKNPHELWKAAKPVATWGYPVRIISTLNGTNNLFYKFCSQIEKGKLNWSFHSTDIMQAVEQGLVDKIYGRKTTKKEREQWLQDEKESCGDEITWLQEYCCVAVDEASAFLTFELINSANEDTLFDELEKCTDDFYVGYDVARKKDLSVISVFEKKGSVFFLRKRLELKNLPFKAQKAILYKILYMQKCRRCCIDSTGIGMQLAEDAISDFGKSKVEAITFTSKTKPELAYKLLYAFQDRNIRFPVTEEITNDLHSIKKIQTSTGVIRFDSDRSETDGHADRFWSFALAIFAGTDKPYQKPVVLTVKRNKNSLFNNELNLNGLGGYLRNLF